MKPAQIIAFLAAALAPIALLAQNPADTPLIEPVEEPAAATETPAAIEPAPVTDPTPATVEPTAPATDEVAADGEAAGNQDMQESEEGFIIKDASLNDIFQFLAKSAERQYFHNSKIAGPEFLVTGHLNDGNPLQQMEELAFMYGLSLHTKGNTIYALTKAQLGQLPSSEYHYQLRYLRPTDIEAIKDLIRPMLSPGTGIVNFEPKTNTVIIIDSAHRIEQAQKLLHAIDKAKGQIIVETKILRVNSSAAERRGVNWSSTLGEGANESGDSVLGLKRSLNSIFGIPATAADTTAGVASSSLVLSPIQIKGVLRSLNEGNLASQVSNPTLITEDNEQATISIIDRIPIITTTTTSSSTGADPTVTEEVRYKIDDSDKSIDTAPESHREIGISLVITPTLLPDGTVRMKMRPRSAQITDFVRSASGNEYPRVTESMVESLARVPDGYSLIVGGFYGETNSKDNTKVPILGDIPVINFFFKSKDSLKEKTSLVFIVTPTSYNPVLGSQNNKVTSQIRKATDIGNDYNWADPQNPGPGHEPNMRRSIRGLQPHEAPFYPRAEAVESKSDDENSIQTQFGRGKR